MKQIVVNDEQAQIITSQRQQLEVRGPNGDFLGWFTPIWSTEDIAEAKRRLAANGPRYTTSEVLEHLSSLEKK